MHACAGAHVCMFACVRARVCVVIKWSSDWELITPVTMPLHNVCRMQPLPAVGIDSPATTSAGWQTMSRQRRRIPVGSGFYISLQRWPLWGRLRSTGREGSDTDTALKWECPLRYIQSEWMGVSKTQLAVYHMWHYATIHTFRSYMKQLWCGQMSYLHDCMCIWTVYRTEQEQ